MSDRRNEEPRGGESPIVEWLRERYEAVTILALGAFMLWVRMQSFDEFTRDGRVFFSGNDAYYHLRQVSYTVRNWPATMPYDVWTNYPFGTNSNQFGTLFDQVVATAALVVGLGSPSQETVALTLLVSPAVIGALIVVPAYYAGRRVGGIYGGLFGALILALLPGAILTRTLVGAADHQAAEALVQMTAVLAFMVAIGVADEEKPVYELVLDRDFEALRRPVGWAALAGVATGLYVWTWPPSVLLVGVVGVFFAIKMAADYYHGTSPEPMAFVAAVSMSVAGVMALLPLTSVEFRPTAWSLLQPLAAFAVAAGAVFMAWLAREWDDRDLERWGYPVSIAAIAVIGALLTSQLLPNLWRTLVNNYERILGFSAGAATRTIREAQPFLGQTTTTPQFSITATEVITIEFGVTFFTAMFALFYMLGRPLFYSRERADHATLVGGLAVLVLVWQFRVGEVVLNELPLGIPAVTVETALVGFVVLAAMFRGNHDGEELFVAVWTLFMTAAAFTQVRFNYYLALAVVVMNAYLVGQFLRVIDVVDAAGNVADEVEPYQVMAMMLAVFVVLPVLVTPITYAEVGQQSRATQSAIEAGNRSGVGSITAWEPSLEWMSNNTPREGTYGGADNRMEYYGTYEQRDDFQYPEGSYGVMSWWDYGHWITVEGERIPNANPFQQGAVSAANFLLAPNESQAREVLQRGTGPNEETRYVVIDWQMVDPFGKFGAPVVFYDDANLSYQEDFVSPFHFRQGRAVYRLNQQRYYESLMVRLYRFNGSMKRPEPIVVDWREETRTDPDTGEQRTLRFVEGQNGIQQYRSMRAARQKLENDSTAALGGLGHWPRERVPAVEHYRLVHASERTTRKPGVYFRPISMVKVFERVPGANVTGHGPPNTTVMASVTMHVESTNATFTYTQQTRTDDEGRYTLTLPYSTTGYENWGPEEGYTNASVRATGPYRISTNVNIAENGTLYAYTATRNVSEAHVIGENESTIRGVDLTYSELGNFGQPGNNTTANRTSNNSSLAALADPARPPADAGSGDAAGDEPPSAAGPVDAATAGSEGARPPARAAEDVPRGGSDEPSGDGAASAGASDADRRAGGVLPRAALVLLVAGAMLLEVRE